jgi:hypothetical protein
MNGLKTLAIKQEKKEREREKKLAKRQNEVYMMRHALEYEVSMLLPCLLPLGHLSILEGEFNK